MHDKIARGVQHDRKAAKVAREIGYRNTDCHRPMDSSRRVDDAKSKVLFPTNTWDVAAAP
eukprot:COSAG02_NODE_350_length_24063_cov_47.131447_1_plen_59_part_10